MAPPFLAHSFHFLVQISMNISPRLHFDWNPLSIKRNPVPPGVRSPYRCWGKKKETGL
jgi:hypothetical protein